MRSASHHAQSPHNCFFARGRRSVTGDRSCHTSGLASEGPGMHARSGLLLAATAALAVVLAIATRSPATPAGSNGAIAFQRYAGPREDDSTSQVFVRSPAGAIR